MVRFKLAFVSAERSAQKAAEILTSINGTVANPELVEEIVNVIVAVLPEFVTKS